MKQTKKLLAFMVMGAALAFAACGKDDNSTANDGNNGGTNGGTETAEWVDLGLPSGLLWAKWNLGATSPEQFGDYYAWGETAAKDVYNWSTYKYCTVDAEGNLATLTKYNTMRDYGSTPDNLKTLEAMDDAATQKLCAGAHIPNPDEWHELINNTTSEWTTLNGVYGRKFTAANGGSLFLPAAGYRWDDILYDVGSGYYLTSSLFGTGSPYNAYVLVLLLDGQVNFGNFRSYGQSVRPVRSAR